MSDLSAYSDEEIKRTAEVGIGLLVLKHIFQPELRARLPQVLALWYTIRHQAYALGYLEAVIRYVMSAGQNISAEDVREALAQAAPEGDQLWEALHRNCCNKVCNRANSAGCARGCYPASGWR